ncbi:hypothetical protein [Sphingomicrobium lutaoense]|uniref:Secreted protein n=1 Tax=Sphingomicrobium lutaoense TaxID=515949 RepID=A0A839Z541_9SPHN|nr:hypothetical protein [Sphingomicrobium lutaoense]MBB3764732.1 hypothetical protein [Sphingomicrobium lutaoense]
MHKKLMIAAAPLLLLTACDGVDTDTDTAIDTTPDTIDQGMVEESGPLVNEVPAATADGDSDDGVADPDAIVE